MTTDQQTPCVLCVPYKKEDDTNYSLFSVIFKDKKDGWDIPGVNYEDVKEKFTGLRNYFDKQCNTKCYGEFDFEWVKLHSSTKLSPKVEILTERTPSVFLGLFLKAAEHKHNYKFKKKYNMICATGDIEYENKELKLQSVSEIPTKYTGDFLTIAKAEENRGEDYLFIYITDNDKEIKAMKKCEKPDNVTIKHYTTENKIWDIFDDVFEPITFNYDIDDFQEEKQRYIKHIKDEIKRDYGRDYGYIAGDDFNNLLQKILHEQVWNGFFIHGMKGTGKSAAAMAIAGCLTKINKIYAPIWINFNNPSIKKYIKKRSFDINRIEEHLISKIYNLIMPDNENKKLTLSEKRENVINEFSSEKKKYLVVVDNLALGEEEVNKILNMIQELFSNCKLSPYLIITSRILPENTNYIDRLELQKEKAPRLNTVQIASFIKNIAKKEGTEWENKIDEAEKNDTFNKLVNDLSEKFGNIPYGIIKAIKLLKDTSVPKLSIEIEENGEKIIEDKNKSIYEPNKCILFTKMKPLFLKKRKILIRSAILLLAVSLCFIFGYKSNIISNIWELMRPENKNESETPNSRTNPTKLTENKWKKGYISSYGDGAEHWYSFRVIKGKEYYIWSNDRNDKEQDKIDIKVTVYYSNGEVIFNNVSLRYEYNGIRSFPASSNDTVYIKVSPSYEWIHIGAYDITYTTSAKRPDWIRPNEFNRLVIDTWGEGNIDRNGDEDWYSFSVKKGKKYYIWINDIIQGNGDKTLNSEVKVFYKKGNLILDLKNNPNLAWDAPLSFHANSNDTVYICVSGERNESGTYGVIYSTSNVRPYWKVPPKPKLLKNGIWEEDSITGSVQSPSFGEVWYSFSVAGGKECYIWLNNDHQGNGTKRGWAVMSAYYSNGVSIFDSIIYAWNTPKTVPTSIDDKVIYVRIYTNFAKDTPTYSVAYSTDNTRPSWNYPSKLTPLSVKIWGKGNITDLDTENWYKFLVTEGENYYIWLNTDERNGTKKLSTKVSVLYRNGNSIITGLVSDYLWDSPTSFTANVTDTVYVRVLPYSSVDTGAYSIVYNTNSTRPGLPEWKSPSDTDTTKLKNGEWTDGSVSDLEDEVWYSFSVNSGEKYYIWLNDGYEGDGDKTLPSRVRISSGNGDLIFSNIYYMSYYENIGEEFKHWNKPLSFTAGSYNKVYVKVSSSNETGNYSIVYSDSIYRPYEKRIGSYATPLTDKVWTYGNINDSEDDWYSLEVTRGTRYYIWLNNGYEGDGTKNANVRVSTLYGPYRADSIFTNESRLWNASWAFDAKDTCTVYVRVSPSSSKDTGTYGVVYSTSSKRPDWSLPPKSITLTENKWVEGDITKSNSEGWHSINVTRGEKYYIWLNDRDEGDGTKTLSAMVTFLYSNGNSIFTNCYNFWNNSKDFTANSTGTVYIRVLPYSSGGTGTYSIMYNTTNKRPDWKSPSDADTTKLKDGEWTDGDITSSKSERWYSFDVIYGEVYYIWINNGREGDGTKNLNARITALYNNGDSIFTNSSYAWNNPLAFYADFTRKVYVRVLPYSSSDTGSYSVVYSTNDKRPSWNPPPPSSLTENKWADGDISKSNSEGWYSFNVTEGEEYYIWLNNRYEGDGTKTLFSMVTVLYSNGDSIFTNISSFWNRPRSFTARSTDTVYVRVLPYSLSDTGTYSVVYSTSSERPGWNHPLNPNPTPLIENKWADGDISKSNSEDWYSFNVTKGKKYYIWLNGRNYGDGTKTLRARVTALYSNWDSIFNNEFYAWNIPRPFTARLTDTVYVRVLPDSSSDTGSYSIVYSTNDTRPDVP